MELQVKNGKYAITGEINWDCKNSLLRCIADDTLVAAREIPGYIDEITADDGQVFCLVQHRSDLLGDDNRVVLQTFNWELHELSSDILESNPNGWFLSCMDMSYIYILRYGTASSGADFGGKSVDFDMVAEMTFIKINRKTGERIEWTLDDLENNDGCSRALENVVNGYVAGISKIHAANGKLIFECDVFEPDSEIECDDPDFDENELSEADYVEYHSFPYTICADLDAKELSYVANNQ